MADKASLTLRSAHNVDAYERAIYKAHVALGADPSFEPESVQIFAIRGDGESVQALARSAAIRDLAELAEALAQRVVALETELSQLISDTHFSRFTTIKIPVL
jgi:hypothetical protein